MKLICYLSNGYPTMEESKKTAEMYGEGGCDIIEVDIPSHNPYLESELISGRMAHALKECGDYDKYLDNIVAIKESMPQTKVIVLAYENTVKDIGVDKFIDFCMSNDLKDVIFVGLENDDIKNRLIAAGLGVSCYVQRQMKQEEIDSAVSANGFIYMQAFAPEDKVSGEYPTLKDCVSYLRGLGIKREIYCGVGVYTPEDYKTVMEAGADGAFVGSTILKLHDKPEELKQAIKLFKAVV